MIVFRNNGLLDTRAFTTFGMSAKETENPIGYFGTGLKYALAVLLRTGHKVDMYIGSYHISFFTGKEQFRNAEFDVIHMRDGGGVRTLPYTTELGKNWEVWQAYRELYCNALDEGGESFEAHAYVHDEDAEQTAIVVDGAQIVRAHHQRSDFILTRQDSPMVEHPLACVYSNPCPSVFYRNMRVLQAHKPTMFTWNFLQRIELTEDRTVKYEFMMRNRMADVVTSSIDKRFIERMITAGEDVYEGHLDYGMATVLTQEFRDTVRECMHKRPGSVIKSAMARAQVSLMELLPEESNVALDPVDRQRLEQAIQFCERIGFKVKDYPLVMVDHIDVGVVGMAANGKIYLTTEAFNRGTKYVAGTLIEEFIHLRYSLDDETRAMQNHLIDRLVGLGERITGKPL